MSFSLGFIVIVSLILFPGLIYRRLYYYGEFSKQFSSGLNIVKLLTISSIPGIVNFICVFVFYDYFLVNIDIGLVIDVFKDINNPLFKFQESNETPLKAVIRGHATPFVSLLYTSSILLGLLSGRLIRITKIDTKFKLFRFNNYWFYLFNGEHTRFKKMRHLKESNRKHLFTKADILIDNNTNTDLYSGIVVDYELQDNDCRSLSKVMLQNATRYALKENRNVPVKIPGTLFVVDCSSMKNINLTMIYEKTGNYWKTKIPNFVNTTVSIAIVLIIPFFLFQSERIDWSWYLYYFNLSWYNKIFAYFLTVQVLGMVNPYLKNEKDKNKEEYRRVTGLEIIAKVIWIVVLIFLIWLF